MLYHACMYHAFVYTSRHAVGIGAVIGMWCAGRSQLYRGLQYCIMLSEPIMNPTEITSAHTCLTLSWSFMFTVSLMQQKLYTGVLTVVWYYPASCPGDNAHRVTYRNTETLLQLFPHFSILITSNNLVFYGLLTIQQSTHVVMTTINSLSINSACCLGLCKLKNWKQSVECHAVLSCKDECSVVPHCIKPYAAISGWAH